MVGMTQEARGPRLPVLTSAVAATISLMALPACSTDSGSPSPLMIVQSDASSLSGMEALLRGTLTADARGCVLVVPETADDSVIPVWPLGYSVRGDSESFEIVDASGGVFARSGVLLNIGGGGAASQSAAAASACTAGRPQWLVGSVDQPE